jgi:hypothetical protein
MRLVTDEEIEALLAEPKAMPPDFVWPPQLRRKARRTYRQASWDLGSDGDVRFVLAARENVEDPLDYSVILCATFPDGVSLNLLRCNGPSHGHRNRLEGQAFGPCEHVHWATERYQVVPKSYAEGFARPTDAFHNAEGAFRAVCEMAAIQVPPEDQLRLFPGEDT